MANKPLKSVQFPGLDDTYTIPQVDTTLAVTGAAADSKKVGDEITELKADLSDVNFILHSDDTEISTIDGYWVDDYGELHTSTARGYLIVPIANVYINGVATLKNGRLGFYQTTVFSMAFLDENYHIISATYSDIIAPATFNISDIPSGAVYVAFNSYSTASPHVMATFAFKSTDSLLTENISDVDTLENCTLADASTEVALTFESKTGYYNINKVFETYSSVTGATVSVTTGEKYLLTSRRYSNVAMAVFFDSNNNVLSVVYDSSDPAAKTDYPITIPVNAVTMLIQRVYSYRTILKKVTGKKAKPITSVLNGKKLSLIGDSITEKNLRAKTNWADCIADWCNATIQNLGASGTGFIAGEANPYSNRIASISNPDIIGVALSFNDMSQSVEDLTDAAEDFFDDLITAYPSTPIICYVQSPWSAYHYGVTTSDAWVNALREVCQTRGVPFYDDMYKGTVLKPWLEGNRAVYYINDGEGSTGEEDWVHPNSEGHKVIARTLYPLFAKNIVATGLDYTN